MKQVEIESDVLIIGGGTAGCYAAIWLGEHTDLSVAVVDKADIRRSGCLAAGVNALNCYITEGHEPRDYVCYASGDADGIAREDLLLDLTERVNDVTRDMERRGLTILKDENGKYVSRGWRNIKINGENIKPILAAEVRKQKNVAVYEHVNVTDLRMDGTRARGAYGFGVSDGAFYEFRARAVLIATGGASGLYRPNNPGEMAHQMWYCPFDTGAGYAMGILAGAEMTSFEMRFIALRCKDTIAPTGTIAQGVGAKQKNSRGEIYEKKYGLRTSERLWGTVAENRAGRGPCFLGTKGIGKGAEQDLLRAYLNMAPLQTLKWLENGGPDTNNVEIEGTEPYVVGGHTASGYWVDRNRQTTVEGLFAAGDVAGGAPQKYVTGALAEGEIAAEGMVKYLRGEKPTDKGRNSAPGLNERHSENTDSGLNAASRKEESRKYAGSDIEKKNLAGQAGEKCSEYERYLENKKSPYTPAQFEAAMQKIMDEYAGGIRTDYIYTEAGLDEAERRIGQLWDLLPYAGAADTDELLALYEVRERLVVCRTLIAHLRARKETRWHGFAENADHPDKDSNYECYINSKLVDGEIKTFRRELVHLQ